MKKVTALLTALTLAVGLAACSAQSTSTASAAPSDAAQSTSTAASASAGSESAAGVVGGDPAEHTVEAIKARGKLIQIFPGAIRTAVVNHADLKKGKTLSEDAGETLFQKRFPVVSDDDCSEFQRYFLLVGE